MINALRSVSRVTQLPLSDPLTALFTEHTALRCSQEIRHYESLESEDVLLTFVTVHTASCNIRGIILNTITIHIIFK